MVGPCHQESLLRTNKYWTETETVRLCAATTLCRETMAITLVWFVGCAMWQPTLVGASYSITWADTEDFLY